MPKLISILSLLICFSLGNLFGQYESVENKPKGNVKSVREVSYTEVQVTEDSTRRSLNYETVEYYHRDGKIRERLALYDTDTTFSKFHYENGKLIEKYYYRKDRDHNKTEIRYNINGDIKARIFTDVLKDTIDFIEIYKYDENDKLIEVGVTDVNGNLKTLYKYDDAGNKVVRLYSWGKVKCKYDSLGREIEMKIYDKDYGLTSTWIKKHEGEYLIEEYGVHHQKGEEYRSVYSYSNFDQEGNWLKKVIRTDNEDPIIIEREIEYYSD